MDQRVLLLLVAFGALLYVLPSSTINHQIQSSTNNDTCTLDCCGTLPSRLPTTFTYYQNTGKFVGGSGLSAINTMGYSGQKQGYLNPALECTQNIGPLPAARYKVGYCKNVMHTDVTRPCSFYLAPMEQSKMCGRSDFFIHGCDCCTNGDSLVPPRPGCSAGCIVISYENRVKIRVGDTIIVEHYQPQLSSEDGSK